MTPVDFTAGELRALWEILSTERLPWVVTNPMLAKISRAMQEEAAAHQVKRTRGKASRPDTAAPAVSQEDAQ